MAASEVDRLKLEGNAAFAAQRYDDAAALYTRAIDLGAGSARERCVLFSNRSAASLARSAASPRGAGALADADAQDAAADDARAAVAALLGDARLELERLRALPGELKVGARARSLPRRNVPSPDLPPGARALDAQRDGRQALEDLLRGRLAALVARAAARAAGDGAGAVASSMPLRCLACARPMAAADDAPRAGRYA